MDLVKYHDGERFVTALHAGEGRKYLHLVCITEGGVRVLDVPREQARFLCVIGPALKKHLVSFRRAGRVFGISKAAREILGGAA